MTSKNSTGMAVSGFLVECQKVTDEEYKEWSTTYAEAWNRPLHPDAGVCLAGWLADPAQDEDPTDGVRCLKDKRDVPLGSVEPPCGPPLRPLPAHAVRAPSLARAGLIFRFSGITPLSMGGTSMSKVFVIDVTRCSGCHNCQLACKDEHCENDWRPYAAPQPPTGQFWCKGHRPPPGDHPQGEDPLHPHPV